MEMNHSKVLVNCFWLSILIIAFQLNVFSQDSDLYKQIKSFPEVVSIQKIDNHPFFKEAYEVMIEQYLDHKNPAAGKFNQRVILSDYNKYSPVIYVAEGYDADYALKDTYINELSKILEGNQLVVEHRYFGKSMPENKNWDYLTMESACDDLHRINKIFKRLYNNQNKWIATGISKGGTNTLAYKAFYPNDMNIWVPYVGPIHFGVEDVRFEKFLTQVGSVKCREKILNFQRQILMGRDSIQPLFDSLSKAKNYVYTLSNEEILDYCVLEYSFAFWQWGSDCNTIPDDSSSYREKFNHFVTICDPDYFAKVGIEPKQSFFVQAAKEMGYYGYDVKLLKPYLKIKNAEGYLPKLFLPENTRFKYTKKTSSFIERTINADGKHVLMIYGGNDPYSACSFRLKNNSKAVKFMVPGKSHRIRINNMPLTDRAKVYMLLETWMNED
jgi:hypothetical protein